MGETISRWRERFRTALQSQRLRGALQSLQLRGALLGQRLAAAAQSLRQGATSQGQRLKAGWQSPSLRTAWRPRSLREVLQSPWTERIVNFVLVPALLLWSLWLPPISLGVRLFHIDYPVITARGGSIGQDGGARLTVAAGALKGRLRLQMKALDVADPRSIRAAEARALKAIPAHLELCGPLYRFDPHGNQPREATFTAPLPTGARAEALDLYAWTGKAWQWLPSQVLDAAGQMSATLPSVPLMVAAMEARPQSLAVGVVALDVAAVNAAPADLASELYVAGLFLSENGGVSDQVTLESAPAHLLVLPTLSNVVKGVARTDWVANIIANPAPRAAHVKAIVEAVNKGGYKGLSLEYQALDEDLRDEFSSFVVELSSALHKAGKVLAVRVDPPQRAGSAWHTAGYDWALLGQAADLVRIPAGSDPAACAPGGALEASLRAAVAQINRQKLQLVISADCYEEAGGQRRALCYGDALSLASQALVAEGGSIVLPGQTVTIRLPRLASGLQEDAASGYLWFAFRDAAGVEHKVWLENASSAARKLALAQRFGLRGVAVERLAGTANDAHIWDAVREARAAEGMEAAAAVASAGGQYKVVWRVESQDGQVVQQGLSPADSPVVAWQAVATPGNYTVSVAISQDEGKTTLGQPGTLSVQIPTPTPSPTPSPTPTPRPTYTPAPTRAPVVAVAAGGTGFDYGIQVDMVTDTNYDRILSHVQQLGFRWIKQQVEWFRYNPGPGQYDWGRLDAIVDACSSRGIKVLFSVVKAPEWARPGGDDRSVAGPPADPGTYAEYMRQMAARYKGRVQAYEIWNEQNLWYEWGGRGRRLSASGYVQLLAAAYRAIKSVDPAAVVISGALTPTGFNDGDTAIDDQAYLEQMYQAGLKNYCDAIGAHPSGFNNPPDADWRSYTDPTCSFRGPQDNRHPSWYFRATMEGYRNIMLKYGDGYKRIWPTEFGWASVDGLGVPPAVGYEYASDNTAAEQAQYIVRAYQMGRNWGFVGPMFLWNLNFAPVAGPQDEKAAFGIVDAGWGPRPAFAALAHMPK